MKRLLCIVSAMDAGGAETFLMKVYRAIDRTQYQFDFCVNVFEKGFYDDEIERLGGRIYRIPSKSSSFAQYQKQLSAIVRDQHYEYVFRTVANAFGLMDLRVAKKAGASRCIARSSNASDGESRIMKAMNVLGRILFLKYADVKLAPSDLAAAYTFGENRYRKGEVHMLHNGLDLNRFCFDEEERARIRKEFRIPDNVKVIGHIGRFTAQKNHAFLIDIFASLRKRTDAVLLLVGKGELEAEIRAKVESLGLSDQVLFLGIRSDVPALLSAMDCMILPSFYEGMPNTVIEAQATALPCLISDTITKEANVTGVVRYCSLREPADRWAQIVLDGLDQARDVKSARIMEETYRIEAVAKQFVKYVFE